jgi:hypothetical protein
MSFLLTRTSLYGFLGYFIIISDSGFSYARAIAGYKSVPMQIANIRRDERGIGS